MQRLVLTATAVLVLLSACASGRTPKKDHASDSYELYTHCGIYEAKIGDEYFDAVQPLDDGSGNPPPGWGNPYQKGTMQRLSATTAMFTDSLGHRVEFRLRPGATTFRRICS